MLGATAHGVLIQRDTYFHAPHGRLKLSVQAPDQAGRARFEIGRTEDDPSDRPAGLSEQVGWLREVGFGEADCHFKWLELALVVAVK